MVVFLWCVWGGLVFFLGFGGLGLTCCVDLLCWWFGSLAVLGDFLASGSMWVVAIDTSWWVVGDCWFGDFGLWLVGFWVGLWLVVWVCLVVSCVFRFGVGVV